MCLYIRKYRVYTIPTEFLSSQEAILFEDSVSYLKNSLFIPRILKG